MKRFNLIPKQRKAGQPVTLKNIVGGGPKSVILSAALIVIAAALVLPGAIAKHGEKNLTKARQQLEFEKHELSRLQGKRLQQAKDYDLLMKKKIAAEERLQYLKEARTDKPIELSQALVYLPTLIPEEIWINKLSVNDEGIIINGSTLNNQAVSGFMDSLNRSDRFKGSSFNYTQKNEVGDATLYNFEIATSLVK